MVCYSLSNRVGYYVAFLEPLIGFGGLSAALASWEIGRKTLCARATRILKETRDLEETVQQRGFDFFFFF